MLFLVVGSRKHRFTEWRRKEKEKRKNDGWQSNGWLTRSRRGGRCGRAKNGDRGKGVGHKEESGHREIGVGHRFKRK